MDFPDPFQAEGRWYKGNLHMHSTDSDGQHSPEELCRVYKKSGYDFICIADHHRITRPEKIPEGMLLIPGAEMNSGTAHVVGIGMKREFDEKDMSVQEIIDAIAQQGALPVIAHPYWSGLASKDLLALENYRIIELYNNVCHNLKGKGYSTVHLDEMLHAGRKIMGIASDDTHAGRDVAGSFVMVKAGDLTAKEIMSSLRQGYFYSSTGVVIKDLQVSQTGIKVRFSPARTVDFMAYKYRGGRVSGEGKDIERAEYKIKGTERFLRIEITDKNNKKAWVNPIVNIHAL